MKILAINGSARRQSNTGDMIDVVLSEFDNEIYEIEKINLVDKTINPCRLYELRQRSGKDTRHHRPV